MSIETTTIVAFLSVRTNRRYLTLNAACAAEARAIIKARYPNERAEYESGHMIYPGFTWKSLPRFEVLYRRMTRIVRAAYKQSIGART
jgi:hypothetical protein